MLECIARIEEYVDDDELRFRESRLVQDAVVRNLQSLAEFWLDAPAVTPNNAASGDLSNALKQTRRPFMKPSAVLEANRELIRRVVLAHRAGNPRVFGSVLRGEDSDQSDLDILVDPAPDASLLDIAHIQVELEKSLGVSVDVLTPGALPAKYRAQVLREARAV